MYSTVLKADLVLYTYPHWCFQLRISVTRRRMQQSSSSRVPDAPSITTAQRHGRIGALPPFSQLHPEGRSLPFSFLFFGVCLSEFVGCLDRST